MATGSAFEVTADMVGNVIEVQVRPGLDVAAGDTLVVVESMKMEIPIPSPATGTVAAVHVTAGDVVQEGDVLVVLDRGRLDR